MAGAYHASFATLCGGTIERLLRDTSGGRHLDVGSGTGALARRAAGLGRDVVAVDSDSDMVAISATVVPGMVVGAALPSLPFDDHTFDAVTANFVLNHVSDPLTAMREIARVVRPGGRLAATVWPDQAQEWALLVSAVFTAARVVPLPGHRLDPALDFDRSASGLRELAESAGLEAITAAELTWVWEISVDALWSGIAGGVATVGRTFLAQTTEVRAAVEREFREVAGDASVNELLSLQSTAVYVVAG